MMTHSPLPPTLPRRAERRDLLTGARLPTINPADTRIEIRYKRRDDGLRTRQSKQEQRAERALADMRILLAVIARMYG